jgi:hypothetical protein
MARRLLGDRMTRTRNSSNKRNNIYTSYAEPAYHLTVVTVNFYSPNATRNAEKKEGEDSCFRFYQYILQVLFRIMKYTCLLYASGI